MLNAVSSSVTQTNPKLMVYRRIWWTRVSIRVRVQVFIQHHRERFKALDRKSNGILNCLSTL